MDASEGVDALAGRSATPPPGTHDESSSLQVAGPRPKTRNETSYTRWNLLWDFFGITLALIWYSSFRIASAYFDNEETSPGRSAPYARVLSNVCRTLSDLVVSICKFWLVAELGGGAYRGTSLVCALVSVPLYTFPVPWRFVSEPGAWKALFVFLKVAYVHALTLPIVCCTAKRRGLVIVALIYYGTITIAIKLAVVSKMAEYRSGLVVGVLYAMLSLFAEHGSWIIMQIIWNRFGKNTQAPRLFFSIQAAIVVANAKSLRLSCLIDALRYTPSRAIQQCSSSIVIMFLGDLVKRLQIAYAVCSRTTGCKSCFPPSQASDLLLRTHLKCGYSPIVSSVFIIFFICVSPPEQEPRYWLAMGAVLLFGLTELMSGIAVLHVQSKMHNLSWRDTWQQLQRSGGHLVFSWRRLQQRMGDEPRLPLSDMDLENQDFYSQLDEHLDVDDQAFFCIPARRMGCIMVSLSVLIVTQLPIRAIHT